ncbi:MAG: alpha amylase C-terminal domain-containing protein [Magnetococcales bacterium]|nr:alpha amylase C-terminal domain-containing protein [Magnetococcales bacterium]
MSLFPVTFVFITGLRQPLFNNAVLTGSWDQQGRFSPNAWSTHPMTPFTAEDGCPAFWAEVKIDFSVHNQKFFWGVRADTPKGPNQRVTPTEQEESDPWQWEEQCIFTVPLSEKRELRYHFTHCRRLGANKFTPPGETGEPGIRFSVWAPHATKVELVRGTLTNGYIDNQGGGISTDPADQPAMIELHRAPRSVVMGDLSPHYLDNIWEATRENSPTLARFSNFDHKPYMFRITKDDGSVAYRTDLYSRCQIGRGDINPGGHPYIGSWRDLDGSKSCSIVVDPDRVVCDFEKADDPSPADWVDAVEFWKDEFRADHPMPNSIDDLVIYELHIGSLGVGKSCASRGKLEVGNFADAMDLLPHLSDLGINAVELLPMGQFQGSISWGYGTSHHMAVEFASGGRDQFKHFVRACHRRGIAVILDVVYNHYLSDGERAEWKYDSDADEKNIYYWYEGLPTDYPGSNPPGSGGYIDNQSTGYAPRFWEAMVRKTFISSAAMLVSEFHLDGFRVDQTTSIHSYPVLHANGHACDAAKTQGIRFLREWSHTLRLVKPTLFLIAEDHSGWDKVTQDPEVGGLGFDAAWYADYYHHLIGDAQNDAARARLLWDAGFGDDRPLAMDYFAGALWASQFSKVVYHESHDEAGNSSYRAGDRDVHSARTLVVAVNNAPLFGDTRLWAEARTRVVAGITLLSAGIPMFLMGEEVGASKPLTYAGFLANREDIPGLRATAGQGLFKFYQDVIALRRRESAFRGRGIDIIHVNNDGRVIAFRRSNIQGEFLVIASLNNSAFPSYSIQNNLIGLGRWEEILNSGDPKYNGRGYVANGTITGYADGLITVAIPACTILVLRRL